MQGVLTECLNHILLQKHCATIPRPVVIVRKYGLPRHITGSRPIPVLEILLYSSSSTIRPLTNKYVFFYIVDLVHGKQKIKIALLELYVLQLG